jgi:hypothetical protein
MLGAPGGHPLPVPPISLEPVALEPGAPGTHEPRAAVERLAALELGPTDVVSFTAGPRPSPASPVEEAPRLVTPPTPLRVPSPGLRAGNGAIAPVPRGLPRPAPAPAHPSNGAEQHDDEPADRAAAAGATGPQLRRFIKSRAYVPMHELRRRFLINGGDDDVTPVDLGERRRVFVGLPDREGRLLGELLRQGDIGYELSLDPITPIVVGVYPMRPVTRP